MSNTKETLETGSLATIVALDAMEERNPLAPSLMVGMPVTEWIGTGEYPGTIKSVSASLKTIVVVGGSGIERTYRLNKRGAYTSGKYCSLRLGVSRYTPMD